MKKTVRRRRRKIREEADESYLGGVEPKKNISQNIHHTRSAGGQHYFRA